MNTFIISLSFIFLVVSSVLAGFTHKIFKSNKDIKPIYLLLSGVFLSIFIIMLFVDYKPLIHGDKATFFLALFHSIQVMLLGYDFEFLYESINLTTKYSSIAYLYISLLFFLAPVYTFGFVLSFFDSVTSYLKYIFKWKSDIYILSDLSDKSLALGKSIRKKFPDSAILFMNVFSDSTDKVYDLVEESKKIKALHFKKNITDIGLKLHSTDTKVTFFTINDNESANLESSLNLMTKFNNRANTELYVFSTSKEGQLLLDSAPNGTMKVRRVNASRSLAYAQISNNPITKNCTKKDGKKIISTLIVGFGGYGSELTKALLWCGQLPDYELEINVVDKSPDAKSRFQAECPEIIKLNRNTAFGEARYSLDFYDNTDVNTYKFNETISKLTNTSVVYVSLGNDELNIETAINIRILFERKGLYPIIRAIVYSDIKAELLNKSAFANCQNQGYDIEFIGNISESYSFDTIVNEELELSAFKYHLRWSDTPEKKSNAAYEFNEYEYYRNSSIAPAIHERYRKSENFSDDDAVVIEHMRWNAYMRTEGFIYSGNPHESTRKDRAKVHNNLHPFVKLDKNTQNIDKRMISDD